MDVPDLANPLLGQVDLETLLRQALAEVAERKRQLSDSAFRRLSPARPTKPSLTRQTESV